MHGPRPELGLDRPRHALLVFVLHYHVDGAIARCARPLDVIGDPDGWMIPSDPLLDAPDLGHGLKQRSAAADILHCGESEARLALQFVEDRDCTPQPL